MSFKKLHEPEDGEMKVVGFMSGTGTNLRKVIEHEIRLKSEEGKSPYRVMAIFSDNFESKASEIGRDYNLPVIIRDIKAFYTAHGLPKKDMTLRPDYDWETVKALSPFCATCAVYAGYMSIASRVLIEAFMGINVHPGDLSITENGKRKWVGDHAVRDAILAGEKAISATTHLVESIVDGGRILMISQPLTVEIPPGLSLPNQEDVKEIERINQEKLKAAGDWVILPQTIESISRGRFSTDTGGSLCFDENPIPHGIRL